MTPMHPYDDIEAFALGSLSEEQQRAVLDHADACPTCAVLAADAMSGVSALAQLEEPLDVSRPAPRVGNVRALKTRRVSPAAWIAGLAAAACIALLLWNLQLRNEALGVPKALPVAVLVHSHFIHHPLKGAAGNAKVLQGLDGSWVYVLADGLSPRSRYELWETRGGAAVEVGEFSTDAHGQAAQYFAQTPGKITELAVTAAGQSPSQDPRALRWP